MAEWPGSQIQRTQMFFTLKQKYPHVSDQIVSHCITTAGGDERAIEELLESPEYAVKPLRKPSQPDRSPEEAGAMALTPSRTACAITRHVPQIVPRIPVTAHITLPYNNGIPSTLPSRVFPNVEQPVANVRIHYRSLADRIHHQRENKRNLEVEMQKLYVKHESLKSQVDELKSQLETNRASDKMELLKREISILRNDCTILNSEVDNLCGVVRNRTKVITTINGGERISWGTEAWHCEMCTFRNHHLLNQCETCSMPRINVGINAV